MIEAEPRGVTLARVNRTHRLVCRLAACGAAAGLLSACGDDSGSGGGAGGGQESAGGAPGEGGAGSIASALVIKNLSVTIDKSEGEMRFTFVLQNTGDKALAQCNEGTIVASTGAEGVVGFDMYGDCHGIVGPNAIVDQDFCPNDVLISLCEDGLPAGESSGIIELTGSTYGDELLPHEQPGTVYTLAIEMLAEDAEPISATAETTVD